MTSFPARGYPAIAVFCQWVNINGENENFGEKEAEWFERIKAACGGEEKIVFSPDINVEEADPKGTLINMMKTFMKAPDAKPYKRIHYDVQTPMSDCMRIWTYEDIREFVQPYEKRVYVSDKTDLATNGFLECLDEQIEAVAGKMMFDVRVNLQLQVIGLGGKNSMYRNNALENPNDNCHSWRDETRLVMCLDGFYDGRSEDSLTILKNWIIENDEKFIGEEGVFCNKDRRLFWGSFARFDDPDGGVVLDTVWDKYFDSKEKYEKLIEIKRRVDPTYTFTANSFGVDATNAPEDKQLKILACGHEN